MDTAVRGVRAGRLALGLALAALGLFLSARGPDEDELTLRLTLGDPKLKGKTMAVAAGAIMAGRSGKSVPFERLIRDLSRARFVYVGESHDSLAMHDIQLRVIEALHAASPEIAVGLEMLPAEVQPVLDRWSQGLLGRDEFLRASRWYVHWSMNFGYYEKILEFVKEKRIPVYALNAPREVISRVRTIGRDGLTEAEKAIVPPLDLGLEDHRVLMRAIFGEADIPHAMKGGAPFEAMFEGLYRAQVAWDEVMAALAVRGAEASKARLIVLAGSGHMIYGLGINRRVRDRNGLPSATVVAVEVGPDPKPMTVSRSLADYVFGIPEEGRPAFPAVGLALKSFAGLANPVIERRPIDGVALGQDFEKGDIVLSVDGQNFDDINELRMYLAGFKWNGECRFRLLRDGVEKDVVLKFREAPPEAPEKKGF